MYNITYYYSPTETRTNPRDYDLTYLYRCLRAVIITLTAMMGNT